MIHNLTASSILNQLILRTPCCPGDILYSYKHKKGKKQKRNKNNANIKSWLTANTVKNHMILRCIINSCRCIYKNTGSLLYICTHSNNYWSCRACTGHKTDEMREQDTHTYTHFTVISPYKHAEINQSTDHPPTNHPSNRRLSGFRS